MAAITPQNGRTSFVADYDPHTYYELQDETNGGINYGSAGTSDNITVTGQIGTSASYSGLDTAATDFGGHDFDVYIVTDAAMLLYIPAGLSHGTVYGIFHNGGGTHAQSIFARATTTGVEIAATHNASGDNKDTLIEEIPDADLPGWFCVSAQFSSEGGSQSRMGLWINGSKVRSATRTLQLQYGSGDPRLGDSNAREPDQNEVRDPSDYSGGDWGGQSSINGSGILIGNFTVDNPSSSNSSPSGGGDAWHTGYYQTHVYTTDPFISDVSPDPVQSAGTTVTLTGVNFEASQGTGNVEVGDDPDYATATKVSQTEDTWSDTSITFDLVATGFTLDSTLYVWVTNDSGDRSFAKAFYYGLQTPAAYISNLSPDHLWVFDGSYADSAGSNPADNSTGGSPTFPSHPLARGLSQSLLIDGLTEYASPANSSNMNDGTQTQRTMSGWIELTDILTALTCIYEEGAQVNNVAVLCGFGNVLMGQVADTGDFYIQAYSDVRLAPDRPYHVVWRFGASGAGNDFTMFVDGQEVAVTKGNPPGASDLDSHTGDIRFGDTGDNLEVGGTDVPFSGPVGCYYNLWASWTTELTDTEISQDLFQASMDAKDTLVSNTQANMQSALDALSKTRTDWPCSIRIPKPTTGSSLELTAKNMVFAERCSYDVEWRGSGTLTWRNSGTSNASKFSTFLGGGSVTVIETAPVKVTVLDIDTGNPIQGAMVLLEEDPGGTDIIKETTDANGEVEAEIDFSTNQAVTGKVRKGSSSTYYKEAAIAGTITSSGLDLTVFMVRDE